MTVFRCIGGDLRPSDEHHCERFARQFSAACRTQRVPMHSTRRLPALGTARAVSVQNPVRRASGLLPSCVAKQVCARCSRRGRRSWHPGSASRLHAQPIPSLMPWPLRRKIGTCGVQARQHQELLNFSAHLVSIPHPLRHFTPQSLTPE
jgi:hypothetical protein